MNNVTTNVISLHLVAQENCWWTFFFIFLTSLMVIYKEEVEGAPKGLQIMIYGPS